MCGIAGYIGQDNSISVVLNILKKLEYRGYDSSGICYKTANKNNIIKEVGKISNLEKELPNVISNIGIGHTRWATHGKVNKINAHPHKVGNVTLVHNGIIENYNELKTKLFKEKYKFKSETDSEVVAAWIDYKLETKSILEVLNDLKKDVIGSYALLIMLDNEDKIYTIKHGSPLVIGFKEDNFYISSDIHAFIDYTNNYYIMEDDEVGEIGFNKVNIYNNLKEKDYKILNYKSIYQDEDNNKYKHFMLKEINEQPIVLKRMFNNFLENGIFDISKYEYIQIVACGSAYHSGLIGKKLIEEKLGIKTDVYIASEYRYQKVFKKDKMLFIAVSQSGETADTIASLELAKQNKIDTLAIVNVEESTIARLANHVIYLNAGVERSVATTKAYSLQILVFSLLVLNILLKNKEKNKDDMINKFDLFINEVEKYIKYDYLKISKLISKSKDIFFIGRQMDYYLCQEASLKLKEVSYIHSEAMAAGELKHGTISLIEKGVPVFAIITDKNIALKTISNIKEVKARGAYVILITSLDIEDKNIYDEIIQLGEIDDLYMPLLSIIPFQLIAYNTALLNGCDVDMPRNLAKSVTVE